MSLMDIPPGLQGIILSLEPKVVRQSKETLLQVVGLAIRTEVKGIEKMSNYEVEYSCDIPNWGLVTLPADNPEQAEEFAYDYVKDLYDVVSNIEITGVKELPNGE